MSPDTHPESHIDASVHLHYPARDGSSSPALSLHDPQYPPASLSIEPISCSYPTKSLSYFSPSPIESVYLSSPTYTPSPTMPTSASLVLPTTPLPASLASPSVQTAAPIPEPDYRFPPSGSSGNVPSQRSRPALEIDPLSPTSPIGDAAIVFRQTDIAHQGRGRTYTADPVRTNIAHPYARLYTRKEGPKRRRMWNHAYEKALFSLDELSLMTAPQRRVIYISCLEAHIDRLHTQLLDYGLYPIPFEPLERFQGLNSRTAKSMVAGLYRDVCELRTKRLELARASEALRDILYAPPNINTPPPGHTPNSTIGDRRHSFDSAV